MAQRPSTEELGPGIRQRLRHSKEPSEARRHLINRSIPGTPLRSRRWQKRSVARARSIVPSTTGRHRRSTRSARCSRMRARSTSRSTSIRITRTTRRKCSAALHRSISTSQCGPIVPLMGRPSRECSATQPRLISESIGTPLGLQTCPTCSVVQRHLTAMWEVCPCIT